MNIPTARLYITMVCASLSIGAWGAERPKITEGITIQYDVDGRLLNESEYQDYLKKPLALSATEVSRIVSQTYQFDGKPIGEQTLFAMLNTEPAAARALETHATYNKFFYAFLGLGALFFIKSGNEPSSKTGDDLHTAISKSMAPGIDRFIGVVAIGTGFVLKKIGGSYKELAITLFNGEAPAPPPEQAEPPNPFRPDPSPF